MAGKASERFVWAVETLEVRPADRLLEVGCGHGVAVSLVCEKLTTGTITAIDRSRKMIEMATRRNREHVDAGRASLEAIALEDADLGDRRFDKVFAFNVAPFWQRPKAALGAVREHLARDGAVYLFWDARHFAPEGARGLGNELADRLRQGGFSVDRVLVADLRPVPAVCAIGRPKPGADRALLAILTTGKTMVVRTHGNAAGSGHARAMSDASNHFSRRRIRSWAGTARSTAARVVKRAAPRLPAGDRLIIGDGRPPSWSGPPNGAVARRGTSTRVRT
jgi:SAM-dependent methyltransferase